ncbi:hypothetical protein DFJ43DRAFT_1221266 [Lentinula guzmanii]|uniref:Uncharacterized protein n=1 Tax=Lentinula guzmanii TaxID=2804957 RepID=A0AA38JZV2_9AGAR|nr:hypothetical protein DFJ43DRAFT_1221266 [Lentinula guzmanii]
MRFNALIWAYLVLQLVSAVYAAPRFDPRAPAGEEASSSKRKGSEDDGSAKRIKIENPSVKEESPGVRVKKESHSPDIGEDRSRVEFSYVEEGKFKGRVHKVSLGEYSKHWMETLVKQTAREKWGWTEGRVESLLFDYPESNPEHWGATIKWFFFKGPFQDCGLKENGCLGEVNVITHSGSVYKRGGRNGNGKGDLVHYVDKLDISFGV